MPPEITLDEVHGAVKTLREEVKSTRVDADKVEKINVFLDEAEEKVFTPITTAKQELKKREVEVKELVEKLETSNASAAEIKERMNALELTLARGIGSGADRDYKESEEYKALNEFCVHGMNSLNQEQKVLLRTDSAVDGGVLVTVELDTVITKKITEIDPIRSVARVRTIGGKSVELPIRNTIPVATYEGEAETGTDSATTYQSSTVTPSVRRTPCRSRWTC